MRFTTDYLNTLTPNGFPRHLLKLKPGMPIMLLRNISPKEGLCNGTRLIFRECLNNKVLKCDIMSNGKEVLIPRIKFIADTTTSPFEWSRRQFLFAFRLQLLSISHRVKLWIWLEFGYVYLLSITVNFMLQFPAQVTRQH